MSEPTGTPTPKDVTPKVPDAPAAESAESPEQTIDGLRAALAKANREAKDNRLARAELDKLKAAQMSELEKLTAERDQAAAERARAEADAMRWRIAAAEGITDADAETFLTGADEETLRHQAKRLRDLMGSAVSGPATPKPDRTQGGTGDALALNSDGLEQALRAKLGI